MLYYSREYSFGAKGVAKAYIARPTFGNSC